MEINKNDTAILVTDPQNDFLSETGVTWELVGGSVTDNNTVGNLERLFKAAKDNGFEVFISPHYYYPTDKGWKFGGTVENLMHEINMFNRAGALSLGRAAANTALPPGTDGRKTRPPGFRAVPDKGDRSWHSWPTASRA